MNWTSKFQLIGGSFVFFVEHCNQVLIKTTFSVYTIAFTNLHNNLVRVHIDIHTQSDHKIMLRKIIIANGRTGKTQRDRRDKESIPMLGMTRRVVLPKCVFFISKNVTKAFFGFRHI